MKRMVSTLYILQNCQINELIISKMNFHPCIIAEWKLKKEVLNKLFVFLTKMWIKFGIFCWYICVVWRDVTHPVEEQHVNNCCNLDVCFSVLLCICLEKKNHLEVTECFIELMICLTYFGHFYAHHQEL